MIALADLEKARQEALDELVDEALEFGLDLSLANRIAPIILRYMNDPRGLEQALIEFEPLVAEKLRLIVKH